MANIKEEIKVILEKWDCTTPHLPNLDHVITDLRGLICNENALYVVNGVVMKWREMSEKQKNDWAAHIIKSL